MMRNLFAVGLLLNIFGKLDACVFLTVSSSPPDMIEVNWDCNVGLDAISVYEQDPEQHLAEAEVINDNDLAEDLDTIHYITSPEGYRGSVPTNISFTSDWFPGNWSRKENGSRGGKSNCLYWMKAQFKEGSTDVTCFKIQPTWMADNKRQLRNLSLPMMFIPGTHNSGSNQIKELKKKRSVSYLDNFVLNQDQSVWNQLVYGIRFLDFRIGYYPGESDPKHRFWINHDFLRLQPLLPVLKDIAEFSRSSPYEVIVLDFHRFPFGFKRANASAIHQELIEIIKRELQDLVIPRPANQLELTLEKIWETKQRLVVSYGEDSIAWENPWLWTGVSHKWGNKQTPEALERFLDKTFRETTESRKLWAAMAELTPTPFHFLSNKSLRSMAHSINYLLNKWFSEKEYWTKKANIVAADFFLGTNLIDVAICENLRRGKEALVNPFF